MVATDVYEGTLTAKEIKAGSLTVDSMDVNSLRAGLFTAGSVTADMLTADAVNGKTIKGVHIIGVQIDGAVLRTGDSGSRVEITQAPASDTQPTTGQVRLLSGAATEVSPAALYSAYDAATNKSTLRLQSAELTAPTPPGGGAVFFSGPPVYPGASLSMWSEPNKGRMEMSATEIVSNARSTLFGSLPFDRIDITSAGSINARDRNDQPAAVYFHNRFFVDPKGWIGLYNQTWKTPSWVPTGHIEGPRSTGWRTASTRTAQSGCAAFSNARPSRLRSTVRSCSPCRPKPARPTTSSSSPSS
ncbi:hypothetical protein ABT071_31290 [Streptomyces sp. NPDC002506]|uniref:hypothetical protein n=1 Tax=Streptomyces sp. NPDC002506 TaxID=3154536 RepID=UPI0033232250